MSLGSTQPIKEMGTRNIPGGDGGKERQARKADNLTAIVSQLSRKCGSRNVPQPYAPPWHVSGTVFPFFYLQI
jgi:hypothetical protein